MKPKKTAKHLKIKSEGNSNSWQNVSDFPKFENSSTASFTSFNRDGESSPSIDSPLKFIKEEGYFTLDKNLIVAGSMEPHHFKDSEEKRCKCGGSCKKQKEVTPSIQTPKKNWIRSFLRRIISLFD